MKLQLVVVAKAFWSDEGQANATREVTKELVKLGVELVAVVHADSYVNSLHEPIPDKTPISIDIKHNLITRAPPISRYLMSRRAAKVLNSIRKDFGRDCVIHSHNLCPSAFSGNGHEETKAIFVTTIHGTAEGEVERFKKEMPVHPRELLYRLAYISSVYTYGAFLRRSKGHFIALSPNNACKIMRQGLPKSRVHVIPNGVDLNIFKPYDRNEARKQLSLPTDKLIVLTINAIQPRKGLHTLIKAAHSVIRDVPEAYFVIVGRIPPNGSWYTTYLRKLLGKLGLNKHFKFTGFVPKEELPFYMSAANVFTLPSYAEGAPLVVPNAMACSRVVIATQSAAAGYLPPNLVVQNGNYDELAQRISFYLSSMKQCRLIGKELRQKALNELSWTKIAKKTLDLYREISTNNPA